MNWWERLNISLCLCADGKHCSYLLCGLVDHFASNCQGKVHLKTHIHTLVCASSSYICIQSYETLENTRLGVCMCKTHPVHTKNDNYKDKDISVHTSERYRLFILSAHSSAALNSRARYSRMDSDWMLIFVSFISWKKLFLCSFIFIAVAWTKRFLQLYLYRYLYSYRAWCERSFTMLKNLPCRC